MDKIFLTGLVVDCIVGVWEWERQVKQTVVVDVEMAVDIRKAAASDNLRDALDYKEVSQRLQTFVGESQFQLVETLAEKVAQLTLAEFQVSWVRVRVKKHAAIRALREVGVEIERRAEAIPGG